MWVVGKWNRVDFDEFRQRYTYINARWELNIDGWNGILSVSNMRGENAMNRKEWIDYINKQLDNRAELLRKIHDELLGLERIEERYVKSEREDEDTVCLKVDDKSFAANIQITSKDIYKICVAEEIEPAEAIKKMLWIEKNGLIISINN